METKEYIYHLSDFGFPPNTDGIPINEWILLTQDFLFKCGAEFSTDLIAHLSYKAKERNCEFITTQDRLLNYDFKFMFKTINGND